MQMAEAADDKDGTDDASGAGPMVLVVEDEEIVRINTCDRLEQAGITAIEAGDADQAMALLEAHPGIRVLVTDVKMPGWMSGIDLARQAEKRWPDISIILTSAFYTADEEELPENMTFFPKPFSPEQLVHQVRLRLEA